MSLFVPLAVAVHLACVAGGFPPFDQQTILTERVDAVAATDVGVIVGSGSSVRVLDPQGRIVRTLWARRASPLTGATARRTTSVPGPTADSGWAPPYDPDDVEPQDDPGLVDENALRGSGRERGTRRTTPGSEGVAGRVLVGAGGDSGWVGRADGLWRVELHGGDAIRVLASTAGGIFALASGTGGRALAALDGGQLLRSADGGATFERAGALSTRPRAFAITDGGNIFIIDAAGASVIRAGAFDRENLGLPGVINLAACGRDAILLTPGASYAVSDGSRATDPPKRGPLPPDAQALACGASGTPWWLWAGGIWTSTDRGLSWSGRGSLPFGHISSVAANTRGVWLATPWGLIAVRAGPTAEKPTASLPAAALSGWAAVASADDWARPSPWRWWYDGLPRIDLCVSTGRTTTRRELLAFVMATFTLGPRSAVGSRSAGLARDLARRRVANAQTLAAWGGEAGHPTQDALAAEERGAMLRILQDPQASQAPQTPPEPQPLEVRP